MKNIEINNSNIIIHSNVDIVSIFIGIEDVDGISVHVMTEGGVYLINLNAFTFNSIKFNSYDELKEYLDNL
jgi:hypothetical protein